MLLVSNNVFVNASNGISWYFVPYPKLFWSWYTGLGSQTQTHKLSINYILLTFPLISGVHFRHCSLLQRHESNVLSYSECKIAKLLWLTPLDWGRLTAPPSSRLPSYTTVFLLATFVEKLAPQKNCWIQHWYC